MRYFAILEETKYSKYLAKYFAFRNYDWIHCVVLRLEADVTMIPQTWVELTDEEAIKKMNRILDLLDADDDVQATYHNWDE